MNGVHLELMEQVFCPIVLYGARPRWGDSTEF